VLWRNVYNEYKVVGMKLEFIPGNFIGDANDSRVTRQFHIGTTQELIPNDATMSVGKLQIA